MADQAKLKKSLYDKKRYQEQRQKKLDYMKEYRLKHPEIRKAWRTKNKNKINANKRVWRNKNRDRVLELRKKYEETDRAKELQKIRRERWKKLNTNKYLSQKLAGSVRYRFKKLGLNKEVISFDVIHLFNVKQCNWCQKEFKKTDKLSFDHIIPISKGGEHIEDNLQILHLKCNLQKGTKLNGGHCNQNRSQVI